MKNVQKLLLAVAVSAALAGCATTRSDSLGLAENEAVKTYAEAYQPARDMLFAGKFDELKAQVLENGKDKEGKAKKKEAKKAAIAKRKADGKVAAAKAKKDLAQLKEKMKSAKC